MTHNLAESGKFVTGLDSIVPSTSTPDYVSLKDYSHATIIVMVNNATTVTGSAITLKQATAVAGTSEKALSFSWMYANVDTAAADALTKTAVTSSTFTTAAVNSKKMMYIIEVDAADCDTNNGFDCIRAGTGDATAATVTVLYYLSGPRYAALVPPAAITD